MKKSISVVVPVYRSSAILEQLYNQVREVLSPLSDNWEIILVDDASNDGTFDCMLELHNRDGRVKLVRFARNTGQHHATLCGLQRAKGDYVLTLDDDLQNPPVEIPRFLEKLDEGFDLVIGRITSERNPSRVRNLASSAIQRLVGVILGKPKDLSLSSYRAMTNRVAKQMGSFQGTHVYIPALMLNSVPLERICNIDVLHDQRRNGRGNYTARKLFKLASYLLINHSRLPLRFVTSWGLMLSLASFAYALFVVMKVVLFGTQFPGWASLAVLVSFLSGNILFFMGIVGEYIGRLVDESSRVSQFPVFEEYF